MGEGSHIYGTSRRPTERGYTSRMVRNVVGLESRIRQNRDESLHVFNSKGDLVTSIQGKGAQVEWGPHRNKIPQNAIITHNHPRAIGKTGLASIGNSFSAADIVTALQNNAREIRAVTPTYTFSMKRPKNGWGVTDQEFMNAYDTFNKNLTASNWKYINKNGSESAIDRANATHYHSLMKNLAKKHGWSYTKTKG